MISAEPAALTLINCEKADGAKKASNCMPASNRLPFPHAG
jgi:hypothetical protein